MAHIRLLLRCVLVSCTLLFSLSALAQSAAPVAACERWVARLISYQGTLSSRRASGVQLVNVRPDETFCVGDVLEIGSYSRAALQLPDETVVRLDQGTIVTFAAPQDDKRTWLDILKGVVHIISRDPRALRVITPFANAGIEGTEFLVSVGADEARVTVYEGRVRVENPLGVATAESGQSVLVRSGSVPVLQQTVRSRDAVVWTLYYPPTAAGPLPEAGAADPAVPSADFYIARAEQRLAVGRLTEAEADLNRALALVPGNAEVLARQSVIALTRNDVSTATALANEAVATTPASLSARLAQSYVRQSAADLPGAIATLEDAVATSPNDGLLLARLAELYLASGDVDRSEARAQAAVAADPGLGLAQTVLGFVHLTRVQLAAAISAFETAIGLEAAAPLPHLGLGLARIRGGDLGAGRAEIETAVILDPGSSLIRSYMGKAYYDEKRGELAASQLELAKQLDPNDPTPWFYDAIRKQTENDPVGALADLQGSIQRNENRAVYRSRLLLDEDLAARSASQGRVYNDLGFTELGLREAWKSVDTDFGDYSGHRLLADSYASRPRHEIARVNELLQSQMLQPLNMTPVQPQLGEANLLVVENAGPRDASFHEFNPLFSRDGLSIQASGVVGGEDTWGNDAVLAGIHEQWSFSLGQFHFETDGFRENNDVKQDVANAIVQYRATDATTLLVEGRITRLDQGDLDLRFDPGNFEDFRQTEDTESLRLGVRHAISNRSLVLLLLNYQNADIGADIVGAGITNDIDQDAYSAELQYQYRGDDWHLTSGLRYFQAVTDSLTSFQVEVPFPPFVMDITDTFRSRPRLLSGYVYGYLDLLENLQLTVGATVDATEGGDFDQTKLSPKLGVRWQPRIGTTIRAGMMETLQPPTILRQDILPSLEPTPVAGFNQFFFGSAGEETTRYGLGIDHRFSDSVFSGAEISRRDIELPFTRIIPPDFQPMTLTADVEETSGRAYLYATPTEDVALEAGYEYDKIENDDDFFPEGFLSIETNRFGLRGSYFHASGMFATLGATYAHQRGRFQAAAPPYDFFSDSDDGTVVDAAIGYRLPRRFGVIRLEARNVFDRQFRFQDVDPANSRIAPERLLLLRLTVSN